MNTVGTNPAGSASLGDLHSTIGTRHPSFWRRAFAFSGPAFLVSVGYMDPGNWATDLEGGARFGYRLLWVLVLSNLMAILLQTMSARLGIVWQRDLAQACRETYPRPISLTLWVFCEIAIAACDLAEVLGTAIGLQLLFHIPLLIGVALTAADTLLLLWFTNRGVRLVEAFVLSLITVIAGCFLVEILWAKPAVGELMNGVIPRLNGQSLYIAIAILGATVMPHNMYLHSALVQTRLIGRTEVEKRTACRFNLIDSVVAMNGAMLVNIAILAMAAAVFFTQHRIVTEIKQAYELLTPMMGTAAASVIFAVALLCSGQSSTLTGTMAGQVVMEGFLNFRVRLWLRRLITRMLAVIPAAIVIYTAGEQATYKLMILSQVILSLQLPFAIVPLLHFTNDRKRMGPFANPAWVKLLAWFTATLVVGLNVWLVQQTLEDWLANAGTRRGLVEWLLVPVLAAVSILLLWVILEPWLPAGLRRKGRAAFVVPHGVAEDLPSPAYTKILVPLDHTPLDRAAIAHAVAMARARRGRIYLLHVEEDVTSQMYGQEASTAEVEEGRRYLADIAALIAHEDVTVELVVRHSQNPKTEIVRYARELLPDLIVMGAHGHKGLKDIIFGTTINAVRHNLRVPLLIVRAER
ncbi:MAG: Nramp family divalent metal transporter [Bryobacteraceae bacterium]|jgi:manganese transport protein